jgi:hypothetical protein
MSHQRNIYPGIALCLCEPVVEIASLDPLALQVEAWERGTDDIGAISASRVLLPAFGIKEAVIAKELGKLALTDLPFDA